MRFLVPTFVAMLASVTPVLAAEPIARQSKQVEGWTILVSEALLEQEPAATEKALDLLAAQLQEIIRVVPAPAVAELRKTRLYFSPEYPGVRPTAEYHPDAGWLREHGRDPEMAQAVEFTCIRSFEADTKRMPNFVLHELAHSYHDRVLTDGFGNEAIKAAYEQAKASGLYESVEFRHGDGRSENVRAYAMTNPMEYFAECSEAFFSVNDFYPFDRKQLARHDPMAFAVLAKLWGDDSAVVAPYGDWKRSGSLWLITTPEGAALPTDAKVEQFPVLVRLHRDFFDFAQAKPDGADVRFSTADGQPLGYQIEQWDAEKGVACVWVRVPRIMGNARQELKMHWGAPEAISESDGKSVFNSTNGYLGVWHMNDPTRDDAGSLVCEDRGTTPATGVIGAARRFDDGHGVFGGDTIRGYPVGAASHSTELWFRSLRPNATLVGWGQEHGQGKVVMQFRSPPHIRMDCYFSGGSVESDGRIALGEWTHVVHTYREGEARLYVNGQPDGANVGRDTPLAIKTPTKLFLGGWYDQYDYQGELDEVRVSQVARSSEWIKLQYENQKPQQTLVGPLVQDGDGFALSPARIDLKEGTVTTIRAQAGGAQQLVWTLKRGGQETIVATNRLSFDLEAGRVAGDESAALTVRALYPEGVKTQEVPISIAESIPDPEFALIAPNKWDGRQTIEVTPRFMNRAALEAAGAGKTCVEWTADDVAVIKQVAPDKLILKRAQGSGNLLVTATIDNGGAKVVRSARIVVAEPETPDEWIARPIADEEFPEDGQFVPCDGVHRNGPRQGTLTFSGTLKNAADSVFVRVYAADRLFATKTATPTAAGKYSLAVKLDAKLVKYRTEFGTKSGEKETVLHRAKNLLCGDVLLIIGQSNAVATDFGKENRLAPSEWVRTFGAPGDGPSKPWADAVARGPDGQFEIGFWGLELGRKLVESEQTPICILNGAVGGTRIDQHQRDQANPTNGDTIYGRLLKRVQQAKLTHGVRAIVWHQGENDQGADGPTGGFGYETYRRLFVDLAACWKEDYPNVQRYYTFQIWPKSCGMGVDGSDNRLREVQRTLPRLFSNLSVLSTVGVKPPGGCHYPAEGYAQFAKMLHPMLQRQLYHRDVKGFDPPNLVRAFFASAERDAVVLEFDQDVDWSDALIDQFHLDGEAKQVKSGATNGRRLTLKLKGTTTSTTVTYLDSANWSPDHLLLGKNGLAALTFCDVPIEAE